jgi:hypothetical protein
VTEGKERSSRLLKQDGWAWWYTKVIPALGRQRQEGGEFAVILSYIGDFASKKQGMGGGCNI